MCQRDQTFEELMLVGAEREIEELKVRLGEEKGGRRAERKGNV